MQTKSECSVKIKVQFILSQFVCNLGLQLKQFDLTRKPNRKNCDCIVNQIWAGLQLPITDLYCKVTAKFHSFPISNWRGWLL